MKPALVIFDCDGVLVDSEPITNRLMAEDMTAHGLPMQTHEAIDLFVGGTIKSVYAKATKMGASLPDDWVNGFYERMIDVLAAEVTAIPGIHAVLDALDAADIPYCVGSNGPMRKMEVTLTRTDMWERMKGQIYSAHDVGIAKPDPGLFLHAAKDQGAPIPGCVVIEDSASGARAAKAATMRCLGYAADTPVEKLTNEGAHPFMTMAELPGLLDLAS